MADPTKYTPEYSYSGWQATNPSRPLPADEVDNDFANVSRSVNQTIDALKDVRRSDGKLKNHSVGPDQLSPALTIGFTFTGVWVDGRSYDAGDGVVYLNGFYSSRVAHTADVANAPGNTAYWNFLYSLDDIVVTGGMTLPRDSFVGDGATTAFTLSFVPLSKFNLFVQVGGVVQGTDDYSANGNTLTFVSPPPNGYDIEVRGFATVATLVTPEDGSVTTVKLADLAVTTEKLAADVTAKLPGLVANTMPVDNAAGTARENKTFAEVRSLLGLVKSIMDYPGAYGNDVDYDDAAFTAAAADPGKTYLPPRPYKFSPGFKCVVPISNYGKTFFSDPGDGTAYNYNSAVIKTNTSGADVSGGEGAAAFDFQGSQQKLINVNFLNLGTVKDAAFRAARFDHEFTGTNADDIDSVIEGCQFTDYGVAVRQNGRGVKMKNCKGGNIGDMLVWSFPATGTAGDPIQSDPILGSRATEILGNRLHNSGTLVKTTGAYAMRGFIIAENDCDLGDTVAHGSFEDGEFAENLCRFSEGREGAYYITGFGSYLTFTGGKYGGGTLTGAMAGTNAIEFETGGDVVGVQINGITGRNFAWHLVSFSTSRPVDCSIMGGVGEGLGRDVVNLGAGSSGLTITGLTGRNYGLDGTSRGFVRFAGAHEYLGARGNMIRPVQATARNFLMIGTPTLTKSDISGNRSTYATLITNAYTDGGSNAITPNILG